MPGLTAYYVVYPANLSSPSESEILAGWPGSAVASGSFPAFEGSNAYTIRELPVDSNLNVAILIQDTFSSNITISNLITGKLLAYYVIYPANLTPPSSSQIIAGWPGTATSSGFFPVTEGLNDKEILDVVGNNLEIALVIVDDVVSNIDLVAFVLNGLTTYYVIYPSEISDPTSAEILSGWSGTAVKAGSFNTIEGYNDFTITSLALNGSYKLAIITTNGLDVSNDLVVLISTLAPTRPRSTRMPRMLLAFPRFRRYS